MAIIDVALEESLTTAGPRPVAPERAAGTPERSRIVAASDAQIGVGLLGAVGTVAAQIAPIMAEAEAAQDGVTRLVDLLGLTTWLADLLPWLGALCFVIVIFWALRARHARIDDHRKGRTM